MKRRMFFAKLVLVGLIMIGLAGCGENKNSREWIENKVSEVSRVYPTENLFDLFKQFPEEFKTSKIGRASVGKECRSRWSPYH